MNKKTILITGGTRGIGWELAKMAAREDYRVILTARNQTLLSQRVFELGQLFPQLELEFFLMDVRNRSDVKKVAAAVGEIDFLINNAGIISDCYWVKMSTQKWDQVIETNLTGTFNVTHYFTQQINPGGQIIMVTSRSALFGNPGQSNYTASKAGIIGFAKTLARELTRFDLRVNCVAPAAQTEMTYPALEKIREQFGGKLPKIWELGSGRAVAEFIIKRLLTVPTTGKVFSVNGGEVGYWGDPCFHLLEEGKSECFGTKRLG